MAISDIDIPRPIGPPVDPSPAKRPERTSLHGHIVTLRPLEAKAHGEALYENTCGQDREWLWSYLFDGPYSSRAEFDQTLAQKQSSSDPLFFAILDKASGVALGYASYLRIDPANRCIEVGNILYTPGLQRTAGATEAMYLMARYAFEDLGYRRYEWKCNALHERSRRAALRLGFRFEGIFRQHMIVKGRNRDTAWFSMLDSEWPARKTIMERWLDPSNFNGDGTQKLSLSTFNAEAAR